MRSWRRTAATLCALAAVAAVAGCSGDDDEVGRAPATTAAPPATTSPPPPAPTTDAAPAPTPAPEALPGLPAFTAGFEDGLRLNRRPIPPAANAPHGEVKNVYVNRTRAQIAPGGDQRFPYPNGTVVVKTGSRAGDARAVVATMRKVAGRDPEHGDWVFTEYSRTGPDAPYTLLAEGAVCWSCHVGAQSTDWVFTRLE